MPLKLQGVKLPPLKVTFPLRKRLLSLPEVPQFGACQNARVLYKNKMQRVIRAHYALLLVSEELPSSFSPFSVDLSLSLPGNTHCFAHTKLMMSRHLQRQWQKYHLQAIYLSMTYIKQISLLTKSALSFSPHYPNTQLSRG